MKKVLLVVDDSEADRYIAERYAKKSGLFDHVYSLCDGEEAYEHFKNDEKSKIEKGDFFPPSVVILDINMPKMNGFEFLEKYSELPQAKTNNVTFVTMLTSSENSKDKEKANSFPIVDLFMTKPLKKEDLLLISRKTRPKIFRR